MPTISEQQEHSDGDGERSPRINDGTRSPIQEWRSSTSAAGGEDVDSANAASERVDHTPVTFKKSAISAVRRLLSDTNDMDGSRAPRGSFPHLSVDAIDEQNKELTDWIADMLKGTRFFSKSVHQVTFNRRNRAMLYDRAITEVHR